MIWIRKFYTVDENPGLGQPGLSDDDDDVFAKTSDTLDVDLFEDAKPLGTIVIPDFIDESEDADLPTFLDLPWDFS